MTKFGGLTKELKKGEYDMESKNKKKNKGILYIIVILMAILILLAIILLNLSTPDKEGVENAQGEEQNLEELANQAIVARLQKLEERDRMEYYFTVFLEAIENGEYEKAYNLLYADFKAEYFPTLDAFKTYAQKTFPEFAVVEHENIERNGDVYVLWVYVSDAINGNPGEKKEINFVIKENYYNDFVMSFSAE